MIKTYWLSGWYWRTMKKNLINNLSMSVVKFLPKPVKYWVVCLAMGEYWIKNKTITPDEISGFDVLSIYE